MRKINSILYINGKRKNLYIESNDSEYLYSYGRYRTKIKPKDLPDDYIKIRCSLTGYKDGYLKTSGVEDIDFYSFNESHLFRDDCVIISYSGKLKEIKKDFHTFYENEDIRIYGSDIIPIILYIQKYSNIDINNAKEKINDRINIFKEKYSDKEDLQWLNQNEDLFEYYRKKMNL